MINLKIGRNLYEITEEDRFLDNGVCVQLVTQSKEKSDFGHRPAPTLSKTANDEISKFQKVFLSHHYGDGCKLFTLRSATK